MKSDSLSNKIEALIQLTESKLVTHSFHNEREGNYEEMDGVKIYHQEFMDKMPYDYAVLLGRFGTLMEIKCSLEDNDEQLPVFDSK